jgi:hypothetical protein
MKKILLDVLFGILTIVVVTIFEFLVTLPFGESGDRNPGYLFIYHQPRTLVNRVACGFYNIRIYVAAKNKNQVRLSKKVNHLDFNVSLILRNYWSWESQFSGDI